MGACGRKAGKTFIDITAGETFYESEDKTRKLSDGVSQLHFKKPTNSKKN